MGILMAKLFLNAWSLIAFLFILNSVSHAIFGTSTFKAKLKNVLMGA
jgi:hypothetical protein